MTRLQVFGETAAENGAGQFFENPAYIGHPPNKLYKRQSLYSKENAGGIIIKPKIILMTKKTLYIVAALLLVAIIGIMLALTYRANETTDAPSSGYRYLQYKDGLYIGTEKTDFGNIKVEVTISEGSIKAIRLVEMPQKLLTDCPGLRDEIRMALDNMVKTQNIVQTDAEKNSAYALNKMTKAVRNALDQSLIVQ